MTDQRKAFARVEIKDADRGEVAAVFSTLNVIDKDGDVTLPGAFTDGAPVAISAFGHRSWDGALPVGKGTIRETSTEGVFEGRFFMDTQHGQDTFRTVKALSEDDGPGQEWSYSLRDVVSERGELDGKKVRLLKKITVNEVSPVLVGAGVDTRTLATKSYKQLDSTLNEALRNAGKDRYADDVTYVWVDDIELDEGWVVFCISPEVAESRYVKVDFTRDGDTVTLADGETEVVRTTDYAPKGGKFSEHAKSVLADVDALVTRATEVMALRAQKGKGLAPESADLLAALTADLDRLKALTVGDPTPPDDAVSEYLRFVALTQGAMQ